MRQKKGIKGKNKVMYVGKYKIRKCIKSSKEMYILRSLKK